MLHEIGPVLVPEFLPPDLRGEEAAAPRPPAPSTNAIPNAEEPVSPALPKRGEVAFHQFIEDQLREGTGSLYAECVKYMECILLTDVLNHTNGNQSQAALLLGITRGCLRSKLRTHGIMISSSIAVQEPPRSDRGGKRLPAGSR